MPLNTTVTDEILIALRRVIRAIDQHSRKLAQSHGLTGPQALLLKEIVRRGSLTGSQLATHASLSQATVTDIVNRLEKRELLVKTRDEEDRRRLLLQATAKGEALISQSVPLLQEKFQEELSRLKEWEQTQLLSSLQRIAEMMHAEQLDAAPLLASGSVTASPEAIKEAIFPEDTDTAAPGDSEQQ